VGESPRHECLKKLLLTKARVRLEGWFPALFEGVFDFLLVPESGLLLVSSPDSCFLGEKFSAKTTGTGGPRLREACKKLGTVCLSSIGNA